MKIKLKKKIGKDKQAALQKDANIAFDLSKGLIGSMAKPLIMAAPLFGWLAGQKGYKHLESPSKGDVQALRQADRALLYDRKAAEIEGRVRRRLAQEGMDLEDVLKIMRT